MWFTVVALLVVSYLIYKLGFSGKSKGFWEQYGIREIDASAAATGWEVFMGKKDITARDEYVYKILGNEKFCGMTEASFNVILVKDVDLIKKIMIKDFEHFADRRDFVGWAKKEATIKKMLPSLVGEQWKEVRVVLTPTFTTGKIRRMMEYFNSVGKDWVEGLKSKATGGSNSSVKMDVVSSVNQYTIDVIASAVFGMNAGTVKDPNSVFATMAKRCTNINVYKATAGFHFPKLFQMLGLEAMDLEALGFFEKILDKGLKSRMSGENKRNDFLQLLVEAKKGELATDASEELSEFEKDAQITNSSKKEIILTDDMLNAQSTAFFFAGFSTTTNAIAFCVYALAAHQDVQNKLRQEIDKIVKPDGSFDYDDINQSVYDMVVSEVLRKFPAGLRIERVCTKDYKDAETGLFVPKGTLVSIPIYSLQNDKRFYEYPEKFYPEHFSPDKKAERTPYAYMPFGVGPRNCIGMRFALTEVKTALAHLVHSFLIEPTEKTPIPMRGDPVTLQWLPPAGLEVKLTPRT